MNGIWSHRLTVGRTQTGNVWIPVITPRDPTCRKETSLKRLGKGHCCLFHENKL